MRTITMKSDTGVHILVPFHALHGDTSATRGLLSAARLQNCPAVFIPVYRG